ncbi:DNA ligase [Candidatus Woesearchaeota archaeon]|nr:MAG: DNA ligase [Candidatus Woesearchaeota archaeon]
MRYEILTGVYQQLESTSKRLQKTKILSDFLRKVPESDLASVYLLVQGKVFPDYDERKIGVAAKLVIKALAVASGRDSKKINTEWKRLGDLGEVAAELVSGKSQRTLSHTALTVKKVFENLRKLAELEGQGSVDRKVKLIAELLTSASPVEAKYIVRTVLEDLRVGLGEGTLRDAIVWAFFAKDVGLKYDKESNKIEVDRKRFNEVVGVVQSAYDVVTDFAEVARIAKTKGIKGLRSVQLSPGKPVKVMLYLKAKGIHDAFETVGRPAACEYKYDGFRVLINKKGKEIKLFTRRLEDVTKQFPDVVDVVKKIKGDFILDSEVVGKSTKGKYLPFQRISQRIRRKYDIAEMAKKYPVEINVFDILYYNGKSLLNTPFKERRAILEKLCPEILAKQIITDDEKVAEKFYKESLAAGNEGMMVKNLKGIYKPGARVGFGVKVKPVMETVDAVIVGAEWGTGKRSKWLASFEIAVLDKDSGEFVEVGKVGTGIKEKSEEGVSFEELTEILKPLIIEEKGRSVKVKPDVVIEVNYEEIQKSPNYSSGFALRFPRFVRLRSDRRPHECTTLDELESFYVQQRGRNKR